MFYCMDESLREKQKWAFGMNLLNTETRGSSCLIHLNYSYLSQTIGLAKLRQRGIVSVIMVWSIFTTWRSVRKANQFGGDCTWENHNAG